MSGSVSTWVALTAYSQMMTPTVAQQNAALQDWMEDEDT